MERKSRVYQFQYRTPIGLDGIGIHNPETRVLKMYTTPLANTIRSMKIDITPQQVKIAISL